MGLGGFGGAGPEGPPNVTEGAGQAPPPTGCLRPYSYYMWGAAKMIALWFRSIEAQMGGTFSLAARFSIYLSIYLSPPCAKY